MIEIEFEEPQKQTFKLYSEDRVLRGRSFDDIIETSAVDLSKVIIKPITANAAANDTALDQFLKELDPSYRFNIIRVGCTFRCAEGEHFSKAWISAPMSIAGEDDSVPLVWSMSPENVSEDVTYSNTVKIGSALEFLTGEASRETKGTQRELFITAYRDGKASPLWEFKKTDNISITGSYACYIVIRSRKEDYIKGKVQVKAVVKKRSYIIFNKEENLENIPFLEFELKPDQLLSTNGKTQKTKSPLYKKLEKLIRNNRTEQCIDELVGYYRDKNLPHNMATVMEISRKISEKKGRFQKKMLSSEDYDIAMTQLHHALLDIMDKTVD